jgi:hypothetical protein
MFAIVDSAEAAVVVPAAAAWGRRESAHPIHTSAALKANKYDLICARARSVQARW